MSNEDKILAMLTTMQQDMAAIKADINSLKANKIEGNGKFNEEGKLDDEGVKRQLDILYKLTHLLNDEEKEALGKYMDAEEERKAAIYG